MCKESNSLGLSQQHQGSILPQMRCFILQPNSLSMRITSWNIRGCNSILKIRFLRRRIENKKPGIIFLQETKCSEDELKVIGEKVWRGSEAIVVDAKGVAGGIGILWNPREVALFDFVASQFSLAATFHILGTHTQGFITNNYDPPRAEHKFNFLDSLSNLKMEARGIPWILGCDFNLVRSLDEKKEEYGS